MNDQPNDPTNTDNWREERRAARRDAAPWAGGLILILIGGILLLKNMNINLPFLDNWWALFILIPAIAALSNAWAEYRQAGMLNNRARGSLIGGAFLSVLSFSLLFGITSAIFWPVILILGGVSLLASGLMK